MKTVLHPQKRKINSGISIVFITIIAFIFSNLLMAENSFSTSQFSANDSSLVAPANCNSDIQNAGSTSVKIEKDSTGVININLTITSLTKNGIRSESKFYSYTKDSVYNDNRPAVIMNNANLSNKEICNINFENIGSIVYEQGVRATKQFGDIGKNGVIIINAGKELYTKTVAKEENSPLYVVNGRIVDKTEAEHIAPSEIKTKRMYDSSSAEAKKYGSKAKNGVVIITIK